MTEQLTHTHNMGLMRAGHWTKIWQFVFFFLAESHNMWDLSSQTPGTEPVPLALEAWSLNHWTTREVPKTWPGFCVLLERG